MYVRVRVNVLRADLREGERDVPPMSSRGDVEKGMDGYAQVYLSWTDRQTDLHFHIGVAYSYVINLTQTTGCPKVTVKSNHPLTFGIG